MKEVISVKKTPKKAGKGKADKVKSSTPTKMEKGPVAPPKKGKK